MSDSNSSAIACSAWLRANICSNPPLNGRGSAFEGSGAAGERFLDSRSGAALEAGRLPAPGSGRGKTGGREKRRLLADAYEAIVGAIYLDGGLPAAAAFLRRTLIDPALADGVEGLERPDHKSALQEWLQQRGLGAAAYRIKNESGPEHNKTFEVEVWHKGVRLSASQGLSKKEAEQAAARLALETLGQSGEIA